MLSVSEAFSRTRPAHPSPTSARDSIREYKNVRLEHGKLPLQTSTSKRHPMTEIQDPGEKLAALNSATMGTTMPTVVLPDGQRVQTGTVGSLIINIKLYDELMLQPTINSQRKAELEAMIAASLPVLRRANMFSLFTPHEWIQGTSPGRRLVGELALQADRS